MYIYKFINRVEEIIYIGKTNNFNRRLVNEHFTPRGHLSEDCYRETSYVKYAQVLSENDAKVYELNLIERYKPKYNIQNTQGGAFSFQLPELQWGIFIPTNVRDVEGPTKGELEGYITHIRREIKRECGYMDAFIRGKDQVTWLNDLQEDDRNEYIRMIYSMERYIRGIEEIIDSEGYEDEY